MTDKPYPKRNSSVVDKDQKRLTTAPIRERPKYTELYKTNNLELPVIRGKNMIKQPVMASRDFKRAPMPRKQEAIRPEHEEEFHKRPQTSKGSRNMNKAESEYYQEGEDDLIVTSMQDKIEYMKRLSKEHPKHQHV